MNVRLEPQSVSVPTPPLPSSVSSHLSSGSPRPTSLLDSPRHATGPIVLPEMSDSGDPERGLRELRISQQRAAASREVVESADKVLSDIRALRGSDDRWAMFVRDALRGT